MNLAKGDKAKEIMDAFEARNEQMKDGTWIDGWRDFCFNSPYNLNYVEGISYHFNPLESNVEGSKEMLRHYIDTEAHTDVLKEILKTFNWTNE